ncbi:hypothetical protein JHK87_019917 [Glycine soja]|nr:hypothetical protein JHK87_019917 [Glycine soja]
MPDLGNLSLSAALKLSHCSSDDALDAPVKTLTNGFGSKPAFEPRVLKRTRGSLDRVKKPPTADKAFQDCLKDPFLVGAPKMIRDICTKNAVVSHLLEYIDYSDKTEAVVLMLECIHFADVYDKLVDALKGTNCLKTNIGFKTPNWESLSAITRLTFIDDSDNCYGKFVNEYKQELKSLQTKCLLFDSKWSSFLKPTDGPFIDETFYGPEIALYSEELNAIGIIGNVKIGCSLMASHLDLHSESSTIVRIYRCLNKMIGKPEDKASRKLVKTITKKVNIMIRWERESSKFFTQKMDSSGDISILKYAAYFSEAISVGVLREDVDHVIALSELIKLGFLVKFNEEAVDFLMESKDLQIFLEDEELSRWGCSYSERKYNMMRF